MKKYHQLGFSLPFTKAFVTFPPQRGSDLRVSIESEQKGLLSDSFFLNFILQVRVLLAHQTQ